MNKALLLGLATAALTLPGSAQADMYFIENLADIKLCFSLDTVSVNDHARTVSSTLKTALHSAIAQQLRSESVPFTTDCKESRYDLQVYVDTVAGPSNSGVTMYTYAVNVFDFDLAEVGVIIYRDSAFGFTPDTGANFNKHLIDQIKHNIEEFGLGYRAVNP